MNRKQLENRKREVESRYGAWISHNLQLRDDLYTIKRGVAGGNEARVRRVLQLVADLAHEPIERLRVLDLGAFEGLFAVELARRGAHAPYPATHSTPPLATDHVLSETRPVNDDRDTAEACTEHPSCIRGFIAKPKYGYPNAAGWWHLEWDQADELWHATDPGSEARDVQVRGEEKLTPPVALIGAFQYVPFHVVVDAIRRKGLFPPEPA